MQATLTAIFTARRQGGVQLQGSRCITWREPAGYMRKEWKQGCSGEQDCFSGEQDGTAEGCESSGASKKSKQGSAGSPASALDRRQPR